MNTHDAINYLARKNNTTPEQVRADMEEAIAAAKDNENFKALFGSQIPSVEEFISAMVLLLRETDTPLQ